MRQLTHYKERKIAARQLREHQTPAEKRLWSLLRSRWLAKYKFRRQFPIGPYFADFCCVQSRLIVELDGAHHYLTADDDVNRTQALNTFGYTVLRFWNDAVLKDPLRVCREVLKALSLSSPSPLPVGEGRLPKATG